MHTLYTQTLPIEELNKLSSLTNYIVKRGILSFKQRICCVGMSCPLDTTPVLRASEFAVLQ